LTRAVGASAEVFDVSDLGYKARVLDLTRVDHWGVRVTDAERAIGFYEQLGFSVAVRHDAASVVILRHPSGLEVNLITNGVPHDRGNVLMDLPSKYSGYTHVALRIANLDSALRYVTQLGIPITEGPVQLGDGTSFFIRDPDGNVIELRSVVELGDRGTV